MDKLKEILNFHIEFTNSFGISVKGVLIVILVLILTSYILKFSWKIITKKLTRADKYKFVPLFNYVKWLVFTVIFLIVLNNSGVNLTAILAASTVLLIGVGLALQTLFQDIISGIFIIIDQTVHVGDIIELDGKVGRVDKINLRTTRAVTIDNRVIVIPNHLYLTNSLYNWTENGVNTRENIEVGVAYGSDTQLVKKILISVANSHPEVLNKPEPIVLFTDFADSALMFKLIFSVNNSFEAAIPKSDIRFEIDREFKENNIQIPFPQRDVHVIQK